MRILPVLFVLLTLADLSAGTLDMAVIQFPEKKTAEELTEALAGVSLSKLTDSNRTMTKKPYLKGGYVLFAQSFGTSRGTGFRSATRLKDSRANVEGRLDETKASVSITLMEGVDSGFRSFTKTVYNGSGPLPSGSPRVLSLKLFSSREVKVLKGRSKTEYSESTVIVVAQYTP